MKILVTGGGGYIGSHTCLELLRLEHKVFVIDNLCNGHIEALNRVQRLSNRRLDFRKCDVRDAKVINSIFEQFQPEVVIHFAGLKSVGESIKKPQLYYDVNVDGTATLLEAMTGSGCKKIVFSSSATVYGNPQYLPCDEKHPLEPINPYGRTKLAGENLLREWANARLGRHALALRYFNPVGADASGEIGEDPNGIPNNLMPFISQVAVGSRECVHIFGDDYDTLDGTGIRDYIHVTDLANAHVAGVELIETLKSYEAINVGTGEGLSVLKMINEFERQSGRSVAYRFGPRRMGDAPAVWADASKAFAKLGFVAKHGVEKMCQDSWRWQNKNPRGYSET